jgi:hypothetical protein
MKKHWYVPVPVELQLSKSKGQDTDMFISIISNG